MDLDRASYASHASAGNDEPLHDPSMPMVDDVDGRADGQLLEAVALPPPTKVDGAPRACWIFRSAVEWVRKRYDEACLASAWTPAPQRRATSTFRVHSVSLRMIMTEPAVGPFRLQIDQSSLYETSYQRQHARRKARHRQRHDDFQKLWSIRDARLASCSKPSDDRCVTSLQPSLQGSLASSPARFQRQDTRLKRRNLVEHAEEREHHLTRRLLAVDHHVAVLLHLRVEHSVRRTQERLNY